MFLALLWMLFFVAFVGGNVLNSSLSFCLSIARSAVCFLDVAPSKFLPLRM